MLVTIKIPDEIGAYIKTHPEAGRTRIAEQFHIGDKKARIIAGISCYLQEAQEHEQNNAANPGQSDESCKITFTDDTGLLEIEGSQIDTLEKALAHAKVDLTDWDVDRHVINSWGVTMKIREGDTEYPKTVTNYQVKVWLKRKVSQPIQEALRALIESLPVLKCPKIKNVLPTSDYAGEMSQYDIHMGKFAWGKETGGGDMDLAIGSSKILTACEDNLSHLAKYPVSTIKYILGNDLMHFENYMAQTIKGQHRLDVDSRLPKAIQMTIEAVLKSIYMCLQVAPVEILWIPGNHDMHASYWLTEIMKHHFKDNPYVKVDNAPNPRKARLWGKLLVAWTHDASGSKMAPVVNMLPQFWPDLWSQSIYREWHTGHKHKKEETKFKPVHTVGGVIVRQIPALSTIDFWHMEECFTDAVPAGESFLWNKDGGVLAHFTSNANYAES